MGTEASRRGHDKVLGLVCPPTRVALDVRIRPDDDDDGDDDDGVSANSDGNGSVSMAETDGLDGPDVDIDCRPSIRSALQLIGPHGTT